MISHLSPAQVELIDLYDADEVSETEFTGLALEAGLSHAQINKTVRDRRQAELVASEDAREMMAQAGQFGAGA